MADERRCGRFAPVGAGIVAVADAQPQDESPRIRVWLRSRPGLTVSLAVRELADTETACTGSESTVDPTCGIGSGELSGSLVQVLSVEPSCFDSRPAVEEPFATLVDQPRALLRLEKAHTCVVLSTRYAPDGAPAEHASQSDQASWVYSFAVS